MKVPTKALFSAFLCIVAVGLIACSHAACTTNCGPGGGTGPFSIGGTVTGLSGTGLTLQNGTDTLVITGNNSFAFKTLVPSGGSYSVVVTQPPTTPSQTCTVANASGKATANVTNVTVTCTTGTVAIGVTVAGLSGTGLVLLDTLQGGATDFLPITGTTTTTQFKTAVPYGSTYNVSVSTQPTSPAQTCTIASGTGSGTATQGVAVNVQVTCSLGTLSIGGTVSGFAGGTGFALQNNGGDTLSITKNGAFTFATLVPVNGAYKVTVSSQPAGPNQLCTVTPGTDSGTATANVSSVQVVCPAVFHPIDVNVVGVLGINGAMQLQDNGGDNLKTPKNGPYTFATPIAHGSAYDVTEFVAPGTQAEGCIVWGFSGTAVSTPVNPIPLVDCGHDDWTWMAGTSQVDQFGATPPPPTPPVLPAPPAPGIFSLTPANAFPGMDVTITGQNFGGSQGGSTVLFNTTPASVTFWSNTVIHVTAPFFGASSATAVVTVGVSKSNSVTFAIPTCPPPVTSTPGGTKYSSTWTDTNGNLWLLTGDGFSSASPPPTQPGFFNELWEFTGTQNYGGNCTNFWTLINQTPMFPFPSARWGAVTWTDPNNGNLMLFGGQDPSLAFLNDLWSFNPTTRTWTHISGGANNPGNYLAAGTPGGTPGGRWGASGKLDALGNFWMFGGFGCDSSGPSCSNLLLNDLWKYNSATGQWTWVVGSPTSNIGGDTTGNYGTVTVTAPGHFPPARQASAAWIDKANNFWMFGGFTTGTNGFNDLWKYDTILGEWTWMSGVAGTTKTPGNFGTQGKAAASNVPGARWLSAAWSDIHGNLWLFGGEGFDVTGNGSLGDLWEYTTDPTATTDPGNPAQVVTGQWVWIRGPSSVSQPGVYGLTPDPRVWPHVTNNPGTRWSPSYWTVKDPFLGTQFWMFGGEGFGASGTPGSFNRLNDLWRYLPYP